MTGQAPRAAALALALLAATACTPPPAPGAVDALAEPVAPEEAAALPSATPAPAPTAAPTATVQMPAEATGAPEPALAGAPTDTWTSPTPVGAGDAARPTEPPLSGPAAPTAEGLPSTFVLAGLTHVYQKWNNCGPSTVLMALAPFGVHLDQLDVQARIKPDREDTNVSPEELAEFARGQGLAARVRFNGNRDIVRALVRAGVPVIAEQWIDVHGRGEMGHYRVVVGYDDPAGQYVVQDSYYGPGRRYGYDEFDRMWWPFLGAYVVIYRPEQEPAVAAAIGADWDDTAMWSRALADQMGRVAAAPGDAWAWYALGEVRAQTGDHAGAVEAFDRAIAIGLPFRAFWYQFGYYRALVATGAYERALAHADATIETMKGENLEESHYWRGVALRHLGREDEARASFERALAFNPLYDAAREAALGGPTP